MIVFSGISECRRLTLPFFVFQSLDPADTADIVAPEHWVSILRRDARVAARRAPPYTRVPNGRPAYPRPHRPECRSLEINLDGPVARSSGGARRDTSQPKPPPGETARPFVFIKNTPIIPPRLASARFGPLRPAPSALGSCSQHHVAALFMWLCAGRVPLRWCKCAGQGG